jgi:hypothetical protein
VHNNNAPKERFIKIKEDKIKEYLKGEDKNENK